MKYLFTVCFAFISLFAAAQTKSLSIPLEKGETYKYVQDLGSAGLLVKTKESSGSAYNLRLYSNDLDLVWEVTIKLQDLDRGLRHNVIATADAQYVYFIESGGQNTGLGSSKNHITQIDRKGNMKTFSITEAKEVNNIQSYFADENFFYYLCTESGKEKLKKKKAEEKMVLHRISNENLKKTSFVLDLPELISPEIQMFWKFIGIKDGHIYISSKINNNSNVQHIITSISSEGKVRKTIKVTTDLGGKFVFASKNSIFIQGGHQLTPIDFSYTNLESPTAEVGAFGGLQFDEKLENLYFFGLYGEEEFNVGFKPIHGYFIFCLDLEGNIKWKKFQKFDQALIDDKSFYKKNPAMNEISFTPKTNGELVFKLHPGLSLSIHAYIHDVDGELKSKTSHAAMFKSNIVYKYQPQVLEYPYPSSKAFTTVNSLDKKVALKTVMYHYFRGPKEILVKIEDGTNKVELFCY